MNAMQVWKNMKKAEIAPVGGMAGAGLDLAVGAAASYTIGQLWARHGTNDDGTPGWGRQVPKVAAIVGTLGAVGIQAFFPGSAHVATAVLGAVGQAGVNAYALEAGIAHGLKATNKRSVRIDANAALPAGAQEAPAIGRKSLSYKEIETLASQMV